MRLLTFPGPDRDADRSAANDAAAPAHRAGEDVCDVCGGTGRITGAHLGAIGMVNADGTPMTIPCLLCEAVPAPAPRRRDHLRLVVDR